MKRTTTNKKKWFVTYVVLCAFLAVSLICLFLIPRTVNPTSDLDNPLDGDGNVIVPGEIHTLPKNMIFRAASVSSGVTLSASIEPLDATNTEVDWRVGWVNADSEWAKERLASDYIQVTPISDGALTATVACKDAFGEQIEIKVISRDNEDAQARCIVDYAKRLESFTVSIVSDVSPTVFLDPNAILPVTSVKLNMDTESATSPAKLFTPTVSLGTLDDSFVLEPIEAYLNPTLVSALKAQGMEVDDGVKTLTTENLDRSFFSFLFGNFYDIPSQRNIFLRTVKERQDTLAINCSFYFSVTLKGKYSQKTELFACNLDTSDMLIRVEGVILDNSTMVF